MGKDKIQEESPCPMYRRQSVSGVSNTRANNNWFILRKAILENGCFWSVGKDGNGHQYIEK